LVATASLNFERKNYTEALNNYMALERVAEFKTNVLEAQIGQMRCLYMLVQYASVINLSDLVLENTNTPEEIKLEAMVSKANALRKMKDIDKAIAAFNDVVKATKAEESAEARFAIAEIYFEQAKYDSVESKVFQMIHATPSYDHWNAKAFILLSDMYYLQGDAFQAKATLQSIIDYHDGDDLVNIAKQKLASIISSEMVKEQESKKRMEINLPTEGGKQYEKLFDVEKPVIDSLPEQNEIVTPENNNDEK
jgi:tetratricopeptide (TPR) repeat protein